MTTYATPMTCMYNFVIFDFGGAVANGEHLIGGPAGKKGRLREVGVTINEVTEFATTLGIIQVGIASDTDAYGVLNIPTGSAIDTVVNSADDTDAIIAADIPADTCVQLTLIEGTGAALTGQGAPYVIIDWY